MTKITYQMIRALKVIQQIKKSVLDLGIPLFLFPTACKFYPSCSEYTIQAIGKYGMIKGGALGGYRILRCTCGAKPGVDMIT